MIQDGLMTPRAVLTEAYVLWAAGAAVGVTLSMMLKSVFIVALMLVGLLGGYFYTAPPVRIGYRGFGEATFAVIFGVLPVAGAFYVQAGFIEAWALVPGVLTGALVGLILFINEFPDEEADRAGGRWNIVLMLGRKGAALVYATAALLTPVSIVVAVVLRALPVHALAATLPSLLLAKPLLWAFGDTREPVPVPALGANVVWNLATNAVLALALAVAVAMR